VEVVNKSECTDYNREKKSHKKMINRTQKNCAVVGETNVVKKVNKKNDKQNTKNCAIIGNVNVKK